MTKARIQVKRRYDKEIAEKGVDFHIVDEDAGVDFGTYTLRHVDVYSQSFTAKTSDKARAARMKNMTDDERGAHNLVDFALLDWSGVEDEDGKVVKYDRTLAVQFFADPENQYLTNTLWRRAIDPGHYQRLDVAEIAKN